jgi:hypothetical protein
MLERKRSEHVLCILGVPVFLHPALLYLVDKPPSAHVHTVQNQVNILSTSGCTRSKAVPITHSISETSREGYAQPRPSPTVGSDNQGIPYPIAFVDIYQVILCPERDKNTGEIAPGKIVLLSVYVNHKSFLDQVVSEKLKRSNRFLTIYGASNLHYTLHFCLRRLSASQ